MAIGLLAPAFYVAGSTGVGKPHGWVEAAPAASGNPSKVQLDIPAGPGHAHDPFVGQSSKGISPHRLTTSPLGSGACSGYSYGSSTWLAYEGYNHTLWVAAYPSCVDVFNSTLWSPNFVTSVNVGSDPFGVAVDNATHEVYVTNTGSGNVSVISALTDRIVATIPVGGHPYGVAYDWRSGDLYVANGGSANVSVISGTNHTVVASVPVGSGPLGVAADPATGQVFVANRWSDNVSILSDSANRVVATVSAGSQPYGVALDNDTDTIYVTNLNSSTITVVRASMDAVLTTIPVVVPATELQGLAYDSATGLLWVGAGGFWAVAINTTLEQLQGYSSFDPSGVAYIPDTGDICVTNTDNFSLGCFNWDIPPTVPLNFSESGLPAGTVWGIGLTCNWCGLNVTNVSTTLASIVVRVSYLGWFPGPTAYSYSVPSVNGYVATPVNGSFDVGNSSIWVNITFDPPVGTYPVVFGEGGLRAGTVWTVVLNDTPGSSAAPNDTFVVPNGTYNFTVRPVAGYSVSSADGNVTVSGSAESVTVRFTPLFVAYQVIFLQIGLHPGAIWGVDLGGSRTFSNTTRLTLYEPNGTFAFTALASNDGYVPTPSQGSVVVDGATVELWITYSQPPVAYSLTFNETGLIGSVLWGVVLQGAFHGSSTNQVIIGLPAGSYEWNLAPPPNGYWVLNATSESGTVELTANVWISIIFTPYYTVTFAEVGLPAGTTWNMTLVGFGSGSESTTPWGAWMPFQVLAGNYTFIAGEAPGYSANPAAGWVNASWNPTVSIAYARIPGVGNATYPVTFTENGLVVGISWTVYVDGAPWATAQTSFVVPLSNGTHRFVVQAPSGFQVNPSLASFEVAGGAVNLSILFSPDRAGTSLPTSEGFSAIALALGFAGGLIAGTIAGVAVAMILHRRRTRNPE